MEDKGLRKRRHVSTKSRGGLMASLSESSQHVTQTICKSLWGNQLSFHPFTFGDDPVNFATLWPDKRSFVAIYQEANLEPACYELCKLLLVTNSTKCLAALLEDGSIHADHNFGAGSGNVTLAHLACALGMSDAVQVLLTRNGSRNGLWSQKDDEEHTAIDVCFAQELRKALPNRSLFRKKIVTGMTLKTDDRERIFKLAAQPSAFYKVIVQLQMYTFDVNKERNAEGDLLIHVAVKGGLPSLPLLFVLVNYFKTSVSTRDANGLTPLCLAAKLGEEKVAEVLVCVLGADINSPEKKKNLWTPLHLAVLHNRPQVVSMLVRRGADAGQEDKNKCDPSFLAQKCQAHECRQIIVQHQRERTELLASQASDGTLKVSRLYPSDACVVSSDGCTLLMHAARNNQEALLRELVKMEMCPLDYRQMKHSDLLDSSTGSGYGFECFLESQHTLKTAVHFAAEGGHATCLKILLNANAHPSIPDANAWLPLHYACDNGHVECVNAITNYPSHHLGLSGLRPALDLAEGSGYGEIVTLLRDAYDRRQKELVAPMLFEVAHTANTDLIFKIFENGDDINPTNESNDWPLLLAAGFGYLDVVKQLHEFGGHVTQAHRVSQSTPLHVAARGGHTKVVKYLLKFCQPWRPRGYTLQSAGSSSSSTPVAGLGEDTKLLDINQRNTAGATPLELAALQGHSDVVRLLLEHGASTTLPDSTGRQIKCVAFSGTQFLIETHRKERMKKILTALVHRRPLKEFEKIWQGPSDFNLRKERGDTILMVAAQYASAEVVRFLIQSAASCKPGMLISPSGKPLPLPCLLSSSLEESDPSDLSLPATPPTLSRHRSRAYSLENSMERPSTALPPAFRATPRRSSRTEHHRHPRRRPPPPSHRHRPDPWKKSASSATITSSGDEDEEEEEGEGGVAGRQGPIASGNGPHIGIIRLTSPRDGQTALHRAADSNQYENVSVLLNEDPVCANIQDQQGNTALHLACRRAHKNTVKTLLSYACVNSSIRNSQMEFPEQACLKSGIRKMVCKHRETQVRQSFPSPPVTPSKRVNGEFLRSNLPSVGAAPTNGVVQWSNQALSGIPEMTIPSQSTDSLSFSECTRKMEELKTQLKQKKDEDGL